MNVKKFSFREEIAKYLTINAAIVYEFISNEIEENRKKKRMFTQKRYWMSMSTIDISQELGFLSPKQVRTSIKMLVRYNYLIKDNFNDEIFDNTSWYAIR